MSLPASRVLAVITTALVAACGGSQATTEEPSSQEEARGGEREEAEDSLSISGLRGTLSQEEVQRALEPRMPKFARCVAKRSGEVEWLSGSLEFSFLVAVDGSVKTVFPTRSNMGDRDTERCALDIARATKFPEPHGGEAEFVWSFEVPLDEEVREPVAWGDAEASELVSTHGSEVTASCGGAGYGITAYVDTDGKVVSAGVASATESTAEQLDCVATAVRGWSFASPGSYPAKIQFSL
jgi:hypothetical protein